MRPTYFNEGLAKRDHLFVADEESRYFGFVGRRHDELDDLCDGEDGAVVSRYRIIFG